MFTYCLFAGDWVLRDSRVGFQTFKHRLCCIYQHINVHTHAVVQHVFCSSVVRFGVFYIKWYQIINLYTLYTYSYKRVVGVQCITKITFWIINVLSHGLDHFFGSAGKKGLELN